MVQHLFRALGWPVPRRLGCRQRAELVAFLKGSGIDLDGQPLGLETKVRLRKASADG